MNLASKDNFKILNELTALLFLYKIEFSAGNIL